MAYDRRDGTLFAAVNNLMFGMEVQVKPGKTTIHYSISPPAGSPIEDADAAEVALNGGVMSTGHVDGRRGP